MNTYLYRQLGGIQIHVGKELLRASPRVGLLMMKKGKEGMIELRRLQPILLGMNGRLG